MWGVLCLTGVVGPVREGPGVVGTDCVVMGVLQVGVEIMVIVLLVMLIFWQGVAMEMALCSMVSL